MSFNKSIALFAGLRPGSSRAEIEAAVADVVDAMVSSVGATSDIRAARRDVAGLLDYLHGLKTSRHPGRVQLATALGERVLPLLYEVEEREPAVKDTYRYLDEEAAVIDRAAEVMGDVLSFLCAEVREHPRHGRPVRDDGIAPLFLFTPHFREGFRRLMSVLVRRYMRNKHSETAVYKPVRDILSGKSTGTVSRYDRQISSLVRTALGRAQEHHSKAKAAGEGTKDPAAKPEVTADTPEQETARDAFEVAHLHAQETGYFLPYALDFDSLAILYRLDRKSVIQGLVSLGHAVLQAETENYVLRQIDRLNDTHDLVHFDITVLSAFMYGDERQRLSYKQLHDTCLGAASSRSVMIRMRPLLAAELARRPHHLARRLLALSEDTRVGREEFESVVELLTRWISCLNERRFEEAIFGCVSQLWGNKILKPLITWIQDDGRNPDLTPNVINDVSILRDEIFQRH